MKTHSSTTPQIPKVKILKFDEIPQMNINNRQQVFHQYVNSPSGNNTRSAVNITAKNSFMLEQIMANQATIAKGIAQVRKDFADSQEAQKSNKIHNYMDRPVDRPVIK